VTLEERFPHIVRYLEAEPDGWISTRLPFWSLWTRPWLTPAEQSAAYDEWADFYQWHLERQADDLARDPVWRRVMLRWTDDMVYTCRRCAAYARGEDPGESIPSWKRRAEETPPPDARPGHAANRQLAAAAVKVR